LKRNRDGSATTDFLCKIIRILIVNIKGDAVVLSVDHDRT